MVTIVSLNGADNVGKTTQIEYLEQGKVAGQSAIHYYNDKLGELVKKNQLREWWWNCGDEEHVETIVEALNYRISSLQSEATVLYLDRGAVMFKAVCIATIGVKNECSLKEARKLFESILLKRNLKFPVEESVRILLKHSDIMEESIRKTLSMEENGFDETYKQYQNLLHNQLQFQEQQGDFTHVLLVGSKSIIKIQNDIRQIVNEYITNSKEHLPLILPSLKMVLVFGGMSECGKSTLALKTSQLLDSLNVPCHKLKIGYLLKTANYSSSPEVLAKSLVDELDVYCRWHHHLNTVTLESLHDVRLGQALKRFLGNTIQIIYLDVSLETRQRRALCSLEELNENDNIKKKRGALQVKDTADLVVDNEKNGMDESTNIILCHVKRNMKVKPVGESFCWFSHKFVLSAGAVLVKMSTKQICLVHLRKRNEWTLPKGRKNEGETLQQAALRETFEESGFQCTLLPVIMETRAPPSVETENSPDEVRTVIGASEPFCITSRPAAATGSQKCVFWFIAKVLEDKVQFCTEEEKFRAEFKSFEEAISLLSFEEDRSIVRKAAKILKNSI